MGVARGPATVAGRLSLVTVAPRFDFLPRHAVSSFLAGAL